MKTILCYGDSNTWGWSPATLDRYAPNVRWPGVLWGELGSEFHIVEEGLPGRTTVWDDPIEHGCNGKSYLGPCLATHSPVDIVIIMLGTNDLKMRFSVPALDIAAGLGVIIDIVKLSQSGPGGDTPKILLVSPPYISPHRDRGEWDVYEGGIEKSKKLSDALNLVADEKKVNFFDAAKIIQPSEIDGIHLNPEAHKILGEHLAPNCKRILSL